MDGRAKLRPAKARISGENLSDPSVFTPVPSREHRVHKVRLIFGWEAYNGKPPTH